MWYYEVTTGKLYNKDGRCVDYGYSGGAGGDKPEAVNNPEFQNVKGVGPLPNGIYTMSELVPHHPRVGAYAILLEPNPANQMFGRDQFFIHGDNQHLNHSASDGCIILQYKTRVVLWEGSDHVICVLDKYNGKD